MSPEMTEGTIFLLGPLDFEKQAMYHLTVLANVSIELRSEKRRKKKCEKMEQSEVFIQLAVVHYASLDLIN
jgi:hypothetical protein